MNPRRWVAGMVWVSMWVGLVTLGAPNVAHGQCQSGHVFAPDGAENDVFGFSVAISGDTMIVAAPQDDTSHGIDAGSVHVFVRSGTAWTHQAQLFASDGTVEDFFGVTVAISGDTAVVGAPRHDHPGGLNAGAAYVFVRSGSVWAEQGHLYADDGAPTDRFGRGVAISGDTIVVASWADDTPNGGIDAGSAYVFKRNSGVWTQEAHLFASDGATNDFFSSYAVAIDGDTIVVGASDDDTSNGIDAGSAYVFVRNGNAWTQQDHLFASDGGAADFFGSTVDISGNTIIVGALGDDTSGGIDAGSAYVFVHDGEGNWSEQAHLLAPGAAPNDNFGWCAIDGDTAVISAFTEDTAAGTDAGSFHVFVRSAGSWTAKMHITPTGSQAFDQFGEDVDISGNLAVVGASLDDTTAGLDAGSAYVFDVGCHPQGDLNCDNAVDLADVPHFIEALLDTGNFTGCEINRADANGDLQIDGRDVPHFVNLLVN